MAISLPSIFIAVPVYQGREFVAETLECIRRQSFTDFRVVMSVDGADPHAAEVCARFTADPRFELSVLPARLGWIGNFNRLLGLARGGYFCYWQQDDLADGNYLEVLHGWARRHPFASCSYSDVTWFGSRSGTDAHDSIVGFALERVLRAIESYHWIALRGLIPVDVLARVGALPETPLFNADFVWIARLAREGELHRVPGTQYYKRGHPRSASALGAPLAADQSDWEPLMQFATDLLQAADPVLADARDRWMMMDRIVARLLVHSENATMPAGAPRFSRWARQRFLLDLVDRMRAHARYAEACPAREARPAWGAIPPFADAARMNMDRDMVWRWAGARERWLRDLAVTGMARVDLGGDAEGGWPLREGWSDPEDWGVWSVGERSRLSVPVPAGARRLRLALRAAAHLLPDRRQLRIDVGGNPLAQYRFDSTEVRALSLELGEDALSGDDSIELRLAVEPAAAPGDAAGGSDRRALGVALHGLEARVL